VTPQEGLSVKVANGEHVTSGGVCRATYMDISSEHFSTDLYILPLDSACWDPSCGTLTI
jgi:hypothetical protein